MIETTREPRSSARLMAALMLTITAIVAVLVVSDSPETVLESTSTQGFAQNSLRGQISQQMSKYDEAIKRVDHGIAHAKLDLIANSQKLGRATNLAVSLHAKLVADHKALLAEAARSRAMKKLRAQLAQKETKVAVERKKLQVDAMGLAQIEQHARSLLSPAYVPAPEELRAVAQEANIADPPPLSLLEN